AEGWVSCSVGRGYPGGLALRNLAAAGLGRSRALGARALELRRPRRPAGAGGLPCSALRRGAPARERMGSRPTRVGARGGGRAVEEQLGGVRLRDAGPGWDALERGPRGPVPNLTRPGERAGGGGLGPRHGAHGAGRRAPSRAVTRLRQRAPGADLMGAGDGRGRPRRAPTAPGATL